MPMVEQMEADEKKAGKDVDVWKAPPTGELAPEEALELLAILLVASKIWAGGPGDQVAGQGPGASLRAQGKAPTIQAE